MRLCVLLLVLLAAATPVRAQDPEAAGPLAYTEWDAGRLSVPFAMIRTRVLYPDAAGPYPLVGLIHGASRTGQNHIETARVLASRGFVVVLPDMPCGLGGCNHDQNAMQITALLEWAVAQSADAGSRLAGKVDESRRGLIGHSWGALASHLAAARDTTIDSVVLFDPNDDAGVGLAATPAITAPEAQLLASVPGACNGAWNEAMVHAMLPSPKLMLTVSRSAHCDPEEPGDFLCPIGCGSGAPATAQFFRRYAVAWTECVLTGNPAMAPWLGGAMMDADVAAPRIEGVASAGLEMLPCRSGMAGTDGGTPDVDAGGPDVDAATGTDASAGDGDAGPADTDGGAAGDDAATARPDAGRMDAGATTDAGEALDPVADDGGCGCAATSGAAGSWPVAASAVVLVLRRRRRRAGRAAT